MTACALRLREPDIRRTLGERIAALRERQEWSQGDLARRLGIGRARLGKWENGEHAPPLAGLIALSETFGVGVDELLTGEDGERAGLAERAGIERAIQILTGWLGPVAPDRGLTRGAETEDPIAGQRLNFEIEASGVDPGAGL